MAGIGTTAKWGRAVGAYLGQDRIVLTEVASTLSGTVVVGQHTQQLNGSGHGEALKQWLETHMTPRQRRHTPVCLGIAAEQTFFATRCLGAENDKEPPSANALLEASGAFLAWERGETAADYVEAKVRGAHAYTVAAAKRGIAEEVLSALDAAGVRSGRLEPAPWSLLKAADRQANPPRRWKLAVRVLLDDADGLAMLVAEGRPVLWRRFAFSESNLVFSITSAVRALQIHARRHFDIRRFAGVFVQGRTREGLARQLEDETGMTVVAASGEGPTEGQCSLALALSAKEDKGRTLDLMRSLRPPPSIREIFPWALVGLILFLTGCMAFLLWDQSTALGAERTSLKRQTASYAWAAPLGTGPIRNERKVLSAEVNAVRRFLSSRIIWSNYLRDLPTRVPENACLSKVWASCELADTSRKKQKRKPKKSMILCGVARFTDRRKAPKEIDAFLQSLRGMQRLKHDFPLVQLAEIKWRKQGDGETALFTILALPKNAKKPG